MKKALAIITAVTGILCAVAASILGIICFDDFIKYVKKTTKLVVSKIGEQKFFSGSKE
ncbi:MAG: hypothetical protein J6L62_03110 [Clostridia bacterium]|nr:hypothetical protein [Clostridia bacterium]MBP3441771.1 hypothetical protein [Clostridia bacterium]